MAFEQRTRHRDESEPFIGFGQLPRAMRDTRVSLISLCTRYQFIAYLVLVLSHSPEGRKYVYHGRGTEGRLTRRARARTRLPSRNPVKISDKLLSGLLLHAAVMQQLGILYLADLIYRKPDLPIATLDFCFRLCLKREKTSRTHRKPCTSLIRACN